MERGKNSGPVFAQRRGGPYTEVRVTVWLGAVIFLSVFIMACGRLSHQPQGDLPDYSLINPTSQKNIRTVVHSVVGISAVVDYRLEFFQYEMAGGKFIPEPGTPTGYRLARGTNAVKTARKTQKISGGGLISLKPPRL